MTQKSAATAFLICCILLSLTWYSCTDSEEASGLYIHQVSNLYSNPAALDSLRQEISTHATDKERDLILEAVHDSSEYIRAAALFVTVLPDKAVAEVFAKPSREVINRLSHLYCSAGDTAANDAFKETLASHFNSLPPSQAADFLVAVASPQEIGLGLRHGDEQIEHEVAMRYSGEELIQFRRAVKDNTLYKH